MFSVAHLGLWYAGAFSHEVLPTDDALCKLTGFASSFLDMGDGPLAGAPTCAYPGARQVTCSRAVSRFWAKA